MAANQGIDFKQIEAMLQQLLMYAEADHATDAQEMQGAGPEEQAEPAPMGPPPGAAPAGPPPQQGPVDPRQMQLAQMMAKKGPLG